MIRINYDVFGKVYIERIGFMCTAVSITSGDRYFGRNLDFEHTFGEKIVISPRKYPFSFTNGEKQKEHYAIWGIGIVQSEYPLYFDAVNEKGVCMAGLNFPGYAKYNKKTEGKENIASFELIPWVLARCKTAQQAKELLSDVSITDEAFNEKMPPTPLHWIIADKRDCYTIEQTERGLRIYKNIVGILTNSPDFPSHLLNLKSYSNISAEEPQNRFCEKLDLTPYSKGMGAIGLPGDYSSMSRFVRACFVALNSEFGETETEKVHQFFHILGSVKMPKGCVRTKEGSEMTNYSCCYNSDNGIFYYTSYFDSKIYAVDIKNENLNFEKLIIYNKEETGDAELRNKL